MRDHGQEENAWFAKKKPCRNILFELLYITQKRPAAVIDEIPHVVKRLVLWENS
jgi:hypothetical protein